MKERKRHTQPHIHGVKTEHGGEVRSVFDGDIRDLAVNVSTLALKIIIIIIKNLICIRLF